MEAAMSLKEHLVVEAVCGVLAEQLAVDVDTAQIILDGYAHRCGQPAREVARAVVDGSLDLSWIDKDEQPPDPNIPPEVLDVLYIEDQENNLVLMRRVFGRWPTMHLDTMVTGGTGLAHIRQHPPDLVLLDGNLPDLDGSEVLRQIRSDPATADLPVIVVSADASPQRVSALMAAGANEYLTKPFDIEHLDRLINDVTTAARPARHADRS
jgi:CheY-like chemotaxis protein